MNISFNYQKFESRAVPHTLSFLTLCLCLITSLTEAATPWVGGREIRMFPISLFASEYNFKKNEEVNPRASIHVSFSNLSATQEQDVRISLLDESLSIGATVGPLGTAALNGFTAPWVIGGVTTYVSQTFDIVANNLRSSATLSKEITLGNTNSSIAQSSQSIPFTATAFLRKTGAGFREINRPGGGCYDGMDTLPPGTASGQCNEGTHPEGTICSLAMSYKFMLKIEVKQSKGAIIGNIFAKTGFCGSGASEIDSINVPINGGRPF